MHLCHFDEISSLYQTVDLYKAHVTDYPICHFQQYFFPLCTKNVVIQNLNRFRLCTIYTNLTEFDRTYGYRIKSVSITRLQKVWGGITSFTSHMLPTCGQLHSSRTRAQCMHLLLQQVGGSHVWRFCISNPYGVPIQ